MSKTFVLVAALFGLGTHLVVAQRADVRQGDSPDVVLKTAIGRELVDGDIVTAVQRYREIATRYRTSHRDIAAKALLQLARSYEKVASPEARNVFEEIVRDFGDQAASVAEARARLGALAAGRAAPAPSGDVNRLLWTSDDIDGRPSADGRYFPFPNYAAGKGGGGNLALRDLVSGELRDLTQAADASFTAFPFFTADGKRIIHSWWDQPTNEWSIRIINVDGSGTRTLVRESAAGPGSASPNGRIAAVPIRRSGAYQIMILHLESGELTSLKSFEWRQPQVGNFSPDGRYLSYSVLVRQDSQDRDIYAIAVDGSSEAKLAAAPAQHRTPFFTPDGQHVVFASNRSGGRWDLWRVPVAQNNAAQSPELMKIDIGSVTSLGFAADGTLFYQKAFSQSDAYEVEIDPATWRALGSPKRIADRFVGVAAAPKWSPDGTTLAYTVNRGAIGPYESGDVGFVVRRGEDEQEIKASIGAFAAASFFRWFPDKKSLLLVKYAAPGRSFEQLDLSTGQVRMLFHARQSVLSTIVSTDGRSVLYPVTDDQDRTLKHIVRRNLETGDEAIVLSTPTGGNGSAAFHALSGSPDGRSFAYIRGGHDAVWVGSLDGSQPRELWRPSDRALAPNSLEWDARGRGVFVTVYPRGADIDGSRELWHVSDDGEAGSVGIEMPGLRVTSVHPNGRRIGFSAGHSTQQLWTLSNFTRAQSAK